MLPVLCWGCWAHGDSNQKDYKFGLWRLLRLSKTKLDGWKDSRTARHSLRNLGEGDGVWDESRGGSSTLGLISTAHSVLEVGPGRILQAAGYSSLWKQILLKGEPDCRAGVADLNQLHPELQHEEPLRHPLPAQPSDLDDWTRGSGPRLSQGRFR